MAPDAALLVWTSCLWRSAHSLPEGEKFVSALARHLSDHMGLHHGVVASQLWQRLSITFWRANARIILHRTPQADLEGWDLPGFVRASNVS